jgi:hypothetical protein
LRPYAPLQVQRAGLTNLFCVALHRQISIEGEDMAKFISPLLLFLIISFSKLQMLSFGLDTGFGQT